MILAYGGKNCWSYKDWLEVDFRVNKNVPDIYCFPKQRVVPFLCFEGGNASGKTCALKVLEFILFFCANSFQLPLQSDIPYDTFFTNTEKSEFFLTFLLNGNGANDIYEYEAILDKKKIYRETLSVKSGKERKKRLLTRHLNTVTDKYFNSSNEIIYKDTASFFSTLFQYEVKKSMPFRSLFSFCYSNVTYLGISAGNPFNTAEYYHEHPDLLKKVTKELQKFDTGISDIEITESTGTKGEKVYQSIFSHATTDGEKKLPFYSQSHGTRLLYGRLLDYFRVLETGGLLVMDEIDNGLHSEIIVKLLAYFSDYTINGKGAQLVFTSHNSRLLDSAKKYRTYLFAKQNGESYCYRADEISNAALRNDRSLSEAYEHGDIGGLPNCAE